MAFARSGEHWDEAPLNGTGAESPAELIELACALESVQPRPTRARSTVRTPSVGRIGDLPGSFDARTPRRLPTLQTHVLVEARVIHQQVEQMRQRNVARVIRVRAVGEAPISVVVVTLSTGAPASTTLLETNTMRFEASRPGHTESAAHALHGPGSW